MEKSEKILQKVDKRDKIDNKVKYSEGVDSGRKEGIVMFAVGQKEEQVVMKKVSMPREFNLRKKGRKIYGAWIGDKYLYLSDEERVLRAKTGRAEDVHLMNIDTENRIAVPASLEHAKVMIRGCISTIELEFTPQN